MPMTNMLITAGWIAPVNSAVAEPPLVVPLPGSQVRLVGITGWVFRGLLMEHPAIALKLMRNLCRTLCLRLYAHDAG